MTPDGSAAGRAGDLAGRVFGFEADFARNLRCIPMAVRRKLDLAGVKLKLVHWHGLTAAERERLVAWPDDPLAISALRAWLLERSTTLPEGPAKAIEPARECAWQGEGDWPEAVRRSCAQLALTVRAEGWRELDELQRFALVKLSHPGHEHRNLPRALAEFHLLEPR